MDIDRDTLLNCPPEEAAAQLYEAGKELQGANLRRSSWLLIANSLHNLRVSDILLQRLQAATTRQDALRVLRIARKNVRERRKGTGGARRHGPQEDPLKVVAEISPRAYQEDQRQIDWEIWEEMEMGQDDFEAWLAHERNMSHKRRQRLAGILPISALDEAFQRYAWDRCKSQSSPEEIRARLDHETYQKVMALAVNQKTGLALSESERSFLCDNHLDDLMRFAETFSLEGLPDPIQDGVALAGVCILEDYVGVHQHPFSVEWQAIQAWLIEQLVHPPKSETAQAVIPSAYAFFRDAPSALVVEFLRTTDEHHKDWASLIGYAAQRFREILPDQPENQADDQDWIMNLPLTYFDVAWERALDAGSGSKLVRHHWRMNLGDLLQAPTPLEGHYWNESRKLLVAGGGTLRRMDYPPFTLVCRPTIAMVQLETFQKLCLRALDLINLHRWVVALHRESLADWIVHTFARLSPTLLPIDIPPRIAGVLEDHAIAYLMLKERVLRDVYQASPFRIRRKHIQRFWNEVQSDFSTIQEIALPTGLQALVKEFGEDAMKEALAHALYDHIKDDWEVPEDQAAFLKESLITMLRYTAITYRLRAPWLPHLDYMDEEDLEHTQEVANFLIQQTENSPAELAQVLMIEARQGLPRLAGGGRTNEERDCRLLVKQIAGVAQEKVGGSARTFCCQPIPKSAALDRGNLGGDCSSGSVPLRALSPHHVYYGVFENGEQQRGYMTVYEAWAEVWEEPARRIPVLCLETINVPMRIFNAVQQDLLLIFEAIAWSRGLVGGLVLITGINTWNFQNGEVLRQSRRFRQGVPVRLFPADPVSWNIYQLIAPEAQYYTAFFDNDRPHQNKDNFRLLARFNPKHDLVEPENLAEAKRIAALPPKRLHITARRQDGPAGFISEYPEIL